MEKNSVEKNGLSLVLGIGEVLWDVLPEGKRCGGAPANVVYHLTKLGIPAAVVSAVGQDAPGDELLDFLRTKGISTQFIGRNGLPTGIVRVTLKDGIPAYDICRPSAWDAITLPEELLKAAENASAVIWGTLAQRDEASRNVILQLLAAVPENCLKCFDVNLRQHYFDADVIGRSLTFADVLKINDEEVGVTAELLHLSGSCEEIIVQLYRQYSLRYVICTLGASGSMLYDGEAFTRYPVRPCKVVDTVGCGDAFLAAWCGTVLKGGTARRAMEEGTLLSSVVAGQPGAMGD